MLLARLVLDARFDAIPPFALQTLILKINAWMPALVVEEPYGYVADDDKKTVFAQWRRAVRESVQSWK